MCNMELLSKIHSQLILLFGCVLHTGALSATNSDDYCISYNVTMVDIRSCTRPCRLPQETFHNSHTGMYYIEHYMYTINDRSFGVENFH